MSRYDSLGASVTYGDGNHSVTTAPAKSRLLSNPLFRFIPVSYLNQITPDHVEIRLALGTEVEPLRVDADTVVLIGFNHSNRDLADFYGNQESSTTLDVRIIGDANGTRRLQDAIAAGAMVGRLV